MGDKVIILSFEIYADRDDIDRIIEAIAQVDNEAARYMIYSEFITNRIDGCIHLSRFDPDVFLPLQDIKDILDSIKNMIDFANVELLDDASNLIGYQIEDGQIIETRGIFIPADDAKLLRGLFGTKTHRLTRRLIREVSTVIDKGSGHMKDGT